MVTEALREKFMDYLTVLNDEQAQILIDFSQKKKQKSLADLKGKIHFSDGYDYKAMRSAQ